MRRCPTTLLGIGLCVGASMIASASGRRPAPVVDVRFDTPEVTAGRTVRLEITSDHPLSAVDVRAGDESFPVFWEGRRRGRARWGLQPLAPPGPRRVDVMWRDEDGRVGTVTRTFTVRPGNYPVGRIRLSKLKDRLLTDGRVERDAAYLNDFYRAPTETHRLWRGPFLRPVEGIVTSVFGARRSYGRRPATTPHMGIDLGAPAGTPVLAANHGRVRFARWLESFGHTVLIDHGQGVFTYYLHMQNSEVAEGARVERGDPIGLVGQEGIATGPHLHWSLVVGGVRVDPAEWLETEIP